MIFIFCVLAKYHIGVFFSGIRDLLLIITDLVGVSLFNLFSYLGAWYILYFLKIVIVLIEKKSNVTILMRSAFMRTFQQCVYH